MRCWLLAVVTAVLWSQCILLGWAEGGKMRKRLKDLAPQDTEAFNTTLSNSEELDGSTKVNARIVSHCFSYMFKLNVHFPGLHMNKLTIPH